MEAVRPIGGAFSSASRVGEQCRATGLGIVNNSHRWGKAELAGWLAGPYRRITLYAQQAGDSRIVNPTAPTSPYLPLASVFSSKAQPLKTEIGAGIVEELLAQLREEVGCLFRGATLSKIEAFSHVCERHGFVVQHVAEDGTSLYLPVDQPRMRLLERVVSLFAADALMNLESYSTVRVCDDCGAVTFGACAHAPSGWQSYRSARIPRED